MHEAKRYMRLALQEAQRAFDEGEVPVGALIVCEDRIVASAHNLVEARRDPTAHAEMLAIEQAISTLGTKRLAGCDLYVTVEPCAMCAGAIVLARLDRLFIGALDAKSGACSSLYEITTDPRLNHRVEQTCGILETECRELMQQFFRRLRNSSSSALEETRL